MKETEDFQDKEKEIEMNNVKGDDEIIDDDILEDDDEVEIPQTKNTIIKIPVSTKTQKSEEKNSTVFSSVFSLLIYVTCSISLILMNKALMYTYKSKFSFSTLFLQNFVGVIFVVLAKHFKYISFRDFDWNVVKRWIVLTILFTLMIETSLLTLTRVSVPVLTAIKSLATVLTASLEWLFFGNKASLGVWFSFFLMVAGTFFAAFDNTFMTFWGCFWAFANVFSTSSYLLYLKYLLKDKSLSDLGKFGPVFYNYTLSLPICLFFAIYFKEYEEMQNSIMFESFFGTFLYVILIFLGSTMGFASVYCMKMNSATTYSVAGSLNKIPVAFFGAVIFNQYPTGIATIGICVTIIGGILYSLYRTIWKKDEKEDKKLTKLPN